MICFCYVAERWAISSCIHVLLIIYSYIYKKMFLTRLLPSLSYTRANPPSVRVLMRLVLVGVSFLGAKDTVLRSMAASVLRSTRDTQLDKWVF